jgi:hypothetical protein
MFPIDIRPGDVFASHAELYGEPEMYVVFETDDTQGIVVIRYLYISGPDAGQTYRAMLKRDGDWGDRRIL